MNENAAEDIRDLTGPESFPLLEADWTPWFGLAAVCLAALALVLASLWLLWLALRPKPARRRQEALRRLEGLRSEARDMAPNQFATQLLRVLREYYHGRYGDRVLFETGPEFARRAAAEGPMEGERKARLERLFERCNDVQFGGVVLPPERRPLYVEEALAILRDEPPDLESRV
ncbi:MAG TPA: DUF4381 family protein [Verrucomicrobiales bacterium]|nr:DUF4381 family protein [Verrucomicrobiales bacterium]